jgi:GH18 family chitinase
VTTRTHRLAATAFALFLLLGLTQPATASGRGRHHEFVKVGYFIQWGIYECSFFARGLANWLYDGTQWWSYDDPVTIARKMVYVRHNRLGGAMVWSLDGDDSRGTLTATIDRTLR